MLNGMVLPMMMLPCIFTGALNMVMAPRLAQSEEKARLCKGILLRLFAAGLFAAAGCSGILWLLAPFFSNVIYRLPELKELFRAATPLCFLCAAENLTGGAVTSLGLQKQTVYGAVPASMASLVITYALTANPAFRLEGVILGLAAGHVLCILWNGAILSGWWRGHPSR
jgi:O-antigen/teichoic acid export membrane protein